MAKGKLIPAKKLIVIGGSAGSLDVILKILPALMISNAALVFVLHRKSSADSTLIDLLAAKTHLPVKEVEEKDMVTAANIFVVPGDYHLLFETDFTFSLDYSEKINYSRPSIDVVFQSASDVYGENLLCILLSGANADGTEGMKYAKENKAVTVAQLPSSAEVPYMPEQAIAAQAADYIYDIPEIISAINNF